MFGWWQSRLDAEAEEQSREGSINHDDANPDMENQRILADGEVTDVANEVTEYVAWQKLLMFIAVTLPMALTAYGYFLINEGDDPPADQPASDSILDKVLWELAELVYENVHLFAAVSTLTNVIFTAIPCNKVYQGALKATNYAVSNLWLAFFALAGGIFSGWNYIDLIPKASSNFVHNLSILSAETELVLEYLGYGFAGTMMYLNTIALHDIMSKMIDFTGDLTQALRVNSGKLNAIKAVLARVFPDKTTSAAALASVALGCLYGYELNRFMVDYFNENLDFMPEWLSTTLTYSAIGAGNYAFGIFFANDGFKTLFKGFQNLLSGDANSYKASIALNQLSIGLLSLAWASLTIIPAMSQASPDPLSIITMVLSPLVFNLPASRGMINALLNTLVLNFEGVKEAILGTGPKSETFNTNTPFKDLRAGRLMALCPKPHYTPITLEQ